MERDIENKILQDFKINSKEAIKLIKKFEIKSSLSSRVIRCIIYLSNGNIDSLKKNIFKTEMDWRDIIMEAEDYCFESTTPFK